MGKNTTMSNVDSTQTQGHTPKNVPNNTRSAMQKTVPEAMPKIKPEALTAAIPKTIPEAKQKPELSLLEMQPLPTPEGFEEASGALLYRMTNDAMFHIVFEACPEALKALIGALLRLRPEDIISVEVTNPVTYDVNVYEKTFVLDLKLLLNGNSILNIEMQVENLHFWKERSLAYLCRIFDNLNRGTEYVSIKSSIQVGILNFDIAPGDTKFYSNYYMIDEEAIPPKKYSDKLRLSVLQLKQVENATEKDRAWHLDLWAKFFRAKTWEEVFMVAKKDPYIASAAQTMYRASADERIRNLCEGRERGELTLRSLQLELQMQKEEARRELQEKDEALLQMDKALLQKDVALQQKDDALLQMDTQLSAALARIAELEASQGK